MAAARGEKPQVQKADPQHPSRLGASRVITGRAGLWLLTALVSPLNPGKPLLLLGKAVAGRLLWRECCCGLSSQMRAKYDSMGRICWRLAAKNCGGRGGRGRWIFRILLL